MPLQILQNADMPVASRKLDLRPPTAKLSIDMIVPPAMIVESLQHIEIA